MRAEEGDETVGDYAAEGRQALGRIESSQRPPGRLRAVARRFATMWRGERARHDNTGARHDNTG